MNNISQLVATLTTIIASGAKAEPLDLNEAAFHAAQSYSDARERHAAEEVNARKVKSSITLDYVTAGSSATAAEKAAMVDPRYLEAAEAVAVAERESGLYERLFDVAKQRAHLLNDAANRDAAERRQDAMLQSHDVEHERRVEIIRMQIDAFAQPNDNDIIAPVGV